MHKKELRVSLVALSSWLVFMFILFYMKGISWFKIGDFSWQTAMAYHGFLVPVWMMLALAYADYTNDSILNNKLFIIGALMASILTGIGSLLNTHQGVSAGTIIQVTGMVVADITALAIIIYSFCFQLKINNKNLNLMAWWTVSIALIGVSLATPLGHLVGAVKDLGSKFPLFASYISKIGLSSNDVVNGFIGSHSHQIVASLLTAGFAMALVQKKFKEPRIVSYFEKTGLIIMLTATVVQIVLYQYCAWFGWEPPNLFANGPNGIPLDDFILSLLGLGMLLVIPALFVKQENDFQFTSKIVAVTILAYIISVVALGIYIEFNEQFFGHAEGAAAGVVNDLAYIRAHLLFGFMIVPILLGLLVNAKFLKEKRQQWFFAGISMVVLAAGAVGVFWWTFALSYFLVEVSLISIILMLIIFALLLSIPKNILINQLW